MHTCYVPADAVVPGLAQRWGEAALTALDEHGLPDLGLDPALAEQVLPRVRAKLATEPVEDLRVDAEDGYRGSADDEDDDVLQGGRRHGRRRGRPGSPRRRFGIRGQVARGSATPPRRPVASTSSSPRCPTCRSRRPRRPREPRRTELRVVVTLPKVTDVEQVRAFLPRARRAGGGARIAVDLEVQIETPQAVIGPDGARHGRARWCTRPAPG